MAKSRPSVQKRKREATGLEKAQQKSARKAERQELRERRAAHIAKGLDPEAFDKALAPDLQDLNARQL